MHGNLDSSSVIFRQSRLLQAFLLLAVLIMSCSAIWKALTGQFHYGAESIFISRVVPTFFIVSLAVGVWRLIFPSTIKLDARGLAFGSMFWRWDEIDFFWIRDEGKIINIVCTLNTGCEVDLAGQWVDDIEAMLATLNEALAKWKGRPNVF